MKHHIITISMALLSITGLNAQEIKPLETSIEDYIMLLNASGYEAYSYDITTIKDKTYTLNFEVREYVKGQSEPTGTKTNGRFRNRTMIKDFMWRELSTEELAEIEKNAVDVENGVYSLAEKVTIGFMPSKNDSTMTGRISVPGMGASGLSLELKPIQTPQNERKIYSYLTRPFKASTFEPGKFIPLALCCSFWYDEAHKVIRCCGEKEIDPELTANILKDSPHYYIIGVTII